MNIVRMRNRLIDSEGLRLEVYQDHLGVWTIGYGSTYWLGNKVTKSWKKISKRKAEAMLNDSLMMAVISASNSVSNFQKLDDMRQEVLTRVIYQIGASGWMRFVKTRAFIEEENWREARREFLDSKMARDPLLKKRCLRYSDQIYHGDNWTLHQRLG